MMKDATNNQLEVENIRRRPWASWTKDAKRNIRRKLQEEYIYNLYEWRRKYYKCIIL